MAKQPEQILEEQLVAQLQKLGYGFACFNSFSALNINSFKNLTLKMFTEFKKGITFAPTVLATLKSERAAYQGESFAFIDFYKRTYTPTLPLYDVHMRGFFF